MYIKKLYRIVKKTLQIEYLTGKKRKEAILRLERDIPALTTLMGGRYAHTRFSIYATDRSILEDLKF